MKIESENKSSHLTIEVNEVEINYPDLNLSLAIVHDDFCEAHLGTWITGGDLAQFLAELQECEKTRRGSAQLDSMSPGELTLRFESDDAAGHFRLMYSLSGRTLGRSTWHQRSVGGSFDLDSSCFAEMTAEFAALAQYKPA